MTDFRRLSRRAVDLAKQSIDSLLYSIQPLVELDKLRDKISDNTRGYSFVHDPLNGLRWAYLELSLRACLDHEGGLMNGSDWKLRMARQYLKKEEQLLELIILILFLRGGQALRTTELFSVECYNGSTTLRGLYAHGGSLMYVTRHSKARRTTN
jgi:hypothetical protein